MVFCGCLMVILISVTFMGRVVTFGDEITVVGIDIIGGFVKVI